LVILQYDGNETSAQVIIPQYIATVKKKKIYIVFLLKTRYNTNIKKRKEEINGI